MKIIDFITEKSNGHYGHAIAVHDVHEIECIVELISKEFSDRSKAELLEFFKTMEVHCLSEENEDDVCNFNFEDFINNLK